MIEKVGKIYTYTEGAHKFEFELSTQISADYGCYFVTIKQTTTFTKKEQSNFGMDKFTLTYKDFVPINTSEFGAINIIGKKYLKNWKNIK